MAESLRDALEEAFAASEAEEAEDKQEELEDEEQEEPEGDESGDDDGDGEAEETGGSKEDPEKQVRDSKAAKDVKGEDKPPTDDVRAPESWKPAVREHWAKLPPAVKEEVARREKEIATTLNQTAGARKFAEAFSQTIRPYEHFLRIENASPLQAIDELFRTSAVLRVGSPADKANLVAEIVKRHGVSIEDLDRALVGQQVPDETGKFRELLKSELGPVNQFMNEFQNLRQSQTQKYQQELDKELADFSKKEFYNDVRETMADMLEMAANRGQAMTLQEAYDKALLVSPEIQQILAKRKNDEVRRKRRAATSLPSRASGVGDSDAQPDDVRGAILAAMDQTGR